jgi:NodT family efflux transporter outer membrane factor (OMF) lipoprotein
MRNSSSRFPIARLGCGALVLATACSVGPDYVRPSAPVATVYKELGDWKTGEPRDEAARGPWWSIYDDAELSRLESQLDAANQNVVAAAARFEEARALVSSARANWYPTVSIGVSATRAHTSDNAAVRQTGPGVTTNNFAMPLQVAWEADVWGHIRRAVESSEAGAQASAGDLASARLGLEAELATDYFRLRTLDAERRLFDDTVTSFEKSLALTQSRYRQGVSSRGDLVLAETQLESTRAQAIDLGVERASVEHAIAVLIGVPPGDFSLAAEHFPTPPPDVPVGVPSALLERRPDVAAAERRAAAANANIGVAEAAYYPQVTLSASGGFLSSDIAKWLVWPSRVWSFGPSVSETVFDGGARGAQTAEARAAYDEAVATYRQTVLSAFQEVEDNLAALRILADEARAQDSAVTAARDSVRITTNQYKAGIVSYLDVAVTQSTALTNERSAREILGRRLASSVLLIEALGGGWDTTALPQGKELKTGVF